MNFKGCFISNRWTETKDKLSVLSPWSGEVVGEVCLAGPGEWVGVKACQAELAQTIMAEGGKPITYARGEVSRGGDDAFPGGEGSAPAEGRCGIEGLRKCRESG